MMGKETYSKAILVEDGVQEYLLNTEGKLNAGIYFITATNENKLYRKKIIVE